MEQINPHYQSLPRDDGHSGDRRLPYDPRSGLVSRLGKFSLALFAISFASCLCCMAFFSFLWTSNSNNNSWRTIVLAGWTTRSITIASLCLRWATAIQAVTCTSMLAAVLLQMHAAPLPNAAFLSIMRFDNTGPWSLLYRMESSWNSRSFSVGFLVTLLCITTLSLQFTSTVLLSQVGMAYLPVSSSVAQTYYGVNPDGLTFNSQLGEVRSYLQTTPPGFPAFAEWSSNATNSDLKAQRGEIGHNSLPGIRDTGTVMRAFLPFGDANERSRLTEYHGYATVVDTRVVCMRPKLSNAVFSRGQGRRLAGLADPEVTPLGIKRVPNVEGSKNFSLSFDCAFGTATLGNHSETKGWPISICRCSSDNSVQGIYSVMEPEEQPPLITDWTESFILINATAADSVSDLDGSDVWAHMTLRSNDVSTSMKAKTTSFQVTLCMTAYQSQEMEIIATRRNSIPKEPTLFWDTSGVAYNTAPVQRQLGADGATISERGLFDLEPRSWKWPDRPEFMRLTGGFYSTVGAIDTVGSEHARPGTLNSAQYAIFAQMARSTSDPAVALQAYLTTLCATSYYDRIIMFDTSAQSSQVSLVDVIRPVGWIAYAAVMSVATFHLLLVLVVTSVFKRAGSLSRIGNAWTVISQILGPNTESWIREADMIDDKTVKSWLKAKGLETTLIRLEEIQGRVQVVSSMKR